MKSGNTIYYRNLGRIPFEKSWSLQESLLTVSADRKMQNRSRPEADQVLPDHYLLFCEHPPVFTLGKSGHIENLLLSDTELAGEQLSFHKINRGGDITFHGPGQLVVYPILDLDQYRNDIHWYLRNLEEVIIRTCADFGILAGRYPGLTGVWLDAENETKARKICAFGVRCSRWITMHGLAFNVSTDLSYFDKIIPCGISDKGVTSLEKELGRNVSLDEVRPPFIRHFSDVFESVLTESTIELISTTEHD